jgi:RNA polymerase sigma factor (TIGR02999 family)
MTSSDSPDLTKLLLSLEARETGDSSVVDRVFELVYDELRRLASALMRGERNGHTLQPTALVHEAYCRLVDQKLVRWQNRIHFFSIASRAMRRILVEHARRRAAAKRGGGLKRVALDGQVEKATHPDLQLIELNDALNQLSKLDERMGRIAELRLFGGLTINEVAHALDISIRTVQYDWRLASAWLSNELADASD